MLYYIMLSVISHGMFLALIQAYLTVFMTNDEYHNAMKNILATSLDMHQYLKCILLGGLNSWAEDTAASQREKSIIPK